MRNRPISALKEGQRECLRLVLEHKTSKEIASELKISPHTVDQRLKSAMRMLDAANRVQAARMLAAHETRDGYQPLVYQSSDIADATPEQHRPLHQTEGSGARAVLGENDPHHHVTVAEFANLESRTKGPRRLPIGRGRNDLGIMQRLGWILLITVGVTLGAGGLLAGLEALSRLAGAS